MANYVDARQSSLIGTFEQLNNLLKSFAGDKSSIIDLRGSNLVVLDKPLTKKQFQAVLRTTPQRVC